MAKSDKYRALILSLLILTVFLSAWQIATMPRQGTQVVDDEYAKLVGASAATGQKSTFPGPVDVGTKLLEHLSDPFYDRGANDKGIGIQLAWSVLRVALGFGLAALAFAALTSGVVPATARVANARRRRWVGRCWVWR